MKKYKLIREYPNSPDIGTILYEKEKCYSWDNEGPYEGRVFDKDIIQNYPEFWEEMKEEKKYSISEILEAYRTAQYYIGFRAIISTDIIKYLEKNDL